MHKIELKRITRVEDDSMVDIVGLWDNAYSKYIIEFKLLSELQESDKKELNTFLTKELVNKQLIHYYGCYLEFDINLREINTNINKITYITKVLNNHYCNLMVNSIEYNTNYSKEIREILISQKESEINKLQNEILIAKKEEEINKLKNEIAILKKDIDK